MIFAESLPDTTYGVDVFAGMQRALVRSKFRSVGDGLCELSVQFEIEQPGVWIELRIWLLRSAMEGRMGLRQVLLHPLEAGERADEDRVL